MNSTRLPDKVLMDIKGKPMLQHIVDRARASNVDNVVVATIKSSHQIITYCKNNNIFYHDQDDIAQLDLLTRFIESGRKYTADIIVRLWGDSPLIRTEDINFALDAHNIFKPDYTFHNRGAGVFTFGKLIKWNVMYGGQDRENFHALMLNDLDVTHRVGQSLPFKGSVDTMEDLEFIRGIYELLP